MGTVLYVLLFAFLPQKVHVGFPLICYVLAPIAFFIGTIVYNVLKFFEKRDTAAGMVQMITGFLAMVLFAVGAIGLFKEGGAVDAIREGTGTPLAEWYSLLFVSFAYFGQMVVFALMPFLKGVAKSISVLHKHKPADEGQKMIAETPLLAPAPTPTKGTTVTTAVTTPKPRKPRTPKTPTPQI